VGAGSILFELPDGGAGMRNVGETPATYFVVRWFYARHVKNKCHCKPGSAGVIVGRACPQVCPPRAR